MSARWEHFEHQADIGVRGYGTTMEQAFEQAGLALISVMVPLDRITPTSRVAVHCEAPDCELLFTDWLNTILREMAVRKMVFSRFQVRLKEGQLSAELWGEPMDAGRHEPSVEVKAATYYALRVWQEVPGGWVAQCVVDV